MVSFGIEKLQGTLSYAAVLHDGCRFSANNIEIILEPITPTENNKNDKNDKKSEKDKNDKSEKSGKLSESLYDKSRESLMKEKVTTKNIPGKSEEGQEGLTFIANWIEVVLARLEIYVENLNIIVNDFKVSKTSLKMHLQQATFYNTNPKMLGNR